MNYIKIREVILQPSAPGPECSLAGVPAGSTAEIRSILFGGIRQALAEAGVHEGDLVVRRPGADRSGAPVYPSGPGGSGQRAKWSVSRGQLTPPGAAT